MRVEKANLSDLEKIIKIYSHAREKMALNGNPTQWGTEYPYEHLLVDDITVGRLYKVVENEETVGVFFMESGPDETYLEIEGKWLNDEPYYVIHRIASSGTAKGVLKAAVDYALQFSKSIKIDTHENNYIMQNALLRLGFKFCGTIYVFAPWEGKSPRMAYHLISDN